MLNGELEIEACYVLVQMEPKFLRNQVPGLIALSLLLYASAGTQTC